MKSLLYVLGLLVACGGSSEHAAAPKQNDPAALADHGVELAKAGKLDEGARELERSAALGNADAWHLLAMLRLYRDDDAGAQQADAHATADPLERPWFLFANGKLDDALAAADQAVPRVGKTPDPEEYVKAVLLRGGVLLELGRFSDAVVALTSARTRAVEVGLADNPYFRAVPLGLLAWAQLRAGDAAAADSAGALEALFAANPDDRLLQIMVPIVRGERALVQGDLAAAEQALAACPSFAMCLYQLADVQTRRGEADAAKATRAKIESLFTLSPPELYYRRKAMQGG